MTICGSARSWFITINSICGGEGVDTVVEGGAGDSVIDGIS